MLVSHRLFKPLPKVVAVEIKARTCNARDINTIHSTHKTFDTRERSMQETY